VADRFDELLDKGPVAVNLGVEDFANSLRTQGAEVIQMDWTPPAGGDREMMELLDQLL
jgi:FdrA protein